MLERLLLSKFRSHARLDIKLHPGVNVFWGKTGSGKSNIFRALYYVARNKPLSVGVFSKSHAEGVCKVVVETETAKVSLARVITKTKKGIKKMADAVYTVTANGKKTRYSKFGSNIPEKVNAALAMGDLNFQHQLDPHFLILSAAGVIMREINKVSRLETLDDINKQLTQEIRGCRNRVEALSEQIAKDKRRLAELPDVEAAGRLLVKAKQVNKRVGKIKSQIDTTEEYIRAVERARLFPNMTEIEGFQKYLDDLIEDVDKRLSKVKLTEKYLGIEASYKVARGEYDAARGKLKAVLAKAKRCPVCGAGIGRKQIENILKEVSDEENEKS